MIKGLSSATTVEITQYFELRRLTATILCAGMGVAGLMASAPVLAYSSIYVFGDSLSDAGQFPDSELGGLNTLRFTNRLGPDHDTTPHGQIATQLLAKELGLSVVPSTSIVRDQAGLPDGTNYAVGGYTTDQILASITQEGGSVVQAGTPFDRSKDGYLVASGGVADSEALYYVNGGGNDFLNGLVTGPEGAVGAAHTLADAVNALAEAGASTIMVANLPDVGKTPAGQAAGPAQAAGTSALVEIFNDALGQRLAALDGSVDIIRLNTDGLMAEILASPGEFGFADDVPLHRVCFDGACNITPYGQGGAQEDPDKLLFNDGVHPTTAGQHVLGDYAYAMLAAPGVLGLAPRLAVGALDATQHGLSNELRPGAQVEGVRVFATGSATEGSEHGRRSDSRESLDSTQRGAGVGVMLPFGHGYGGVAVSQRYGEFDLDNGSDLDVEGQVFSLFARQHLGPVGVQAVASYGDFALDLDRHVRLGESSRTLSGDPDGDGFGAEVRVDYRLTDSDSLWYTAPFMAYRHVEADIDGYREAGSAANALIVSSQNLKERRVELGFMADRGLMDGYGLYAEAALGEHLGDDPKAAEVRLASLPGNAWRADDMERDSDHYLRVDAGWRMQLGENGMLHLGAGAETWDEVAAHFEVGASLAF